MGIESNRRTDKQQKFGIANDQRLCDALWSLFWVGLAFLTAVLAAW